MTTLLAADDWGWRGPFGNGHADPGQRIPSEWSVDSNVAWVANVPGRGHSSLVISGNQIFLTTADEERSTQSALCYDLDSGKLLWNTTCHANVRLPRMHRKNTQASSSIAVGDGAVFAVFCNDDQIQVSALGLDGKILWQRSIGQWIPTRYQFGYGQTPIFHQGKLIVTAESETEPFVMALNPQDGSQVWMITRPKATSYGTPVIAKIGGAEQLLLSGGQNVAGYDPQSGKELWNADASWVVACGTMVWHPSQPIVFASGGYPTKQTLAIKADGSGDILWENNIKCYEQSLIVADGCVYGYAEGGVLYCWDAMTGQELWKERLGGNGESASPVLADGRLHFTNEEGTTWVIRPNRQRFDLVAKNQLEEEMFASMAVVQNSILMRVADHSGGRQERLFRIRN